VPDRHSFFGDQLRGDGLTGNTPAWQSSQLISPVFVYRRRIRIRDCAVAVVRVWVRLQRQRCGQFADQAPNNGTSWQTLASSSGQQCGLVAALGGLTAYAGKSVQSAFDWFSGDHYYNSGPGWFVIMLRW